MAIPYRTAKFKSANILAIAILGSTAKFNARQCFRLYGKLISVLLGQFGDISTHALKWYLKICHILSHMHAHFLNNAHPQVCMYLTCTHKTYILIYLQKCPFCIHKYFTVIVWSHMLQILNRNSWASLSSLMPGLPGRVHSGWLNLRLGLSSRR